MKEKINKKSKLFIKKFLNWIYSSIPYLGFSLFLLVMGSILLVVNFDKSSIYPFKLKFVTDWIIVIFLIISTLFSIKFLISLKKGGNIYHKYFGSFVATFSISNWIAMCFLIKNRKVSLSDVKIAIRNTYIYNYLLLVLCLIGVIWCLYLTRRYLKFTNLWIIVVILPYLLILYQIGITVKGLQTFTNYSDYSPEILKMFVNSNKYGDINLINQTVYYSIAYQMVALILLEGGRIFVYLNKLVEKKNKYK